MRVLTMCKMHFTSALIEKNQPFVESNVICYKCNITSWRGFVKLHQMEREARRMEGENLMK